MNVCLLSCASILCVAKLLELFTSLHLRSISVHANRYTAPSRKADLNVRRYEESDGSAFDDEDASDEEAPRK